MKSNTVRVVLFATAVSLLALQADRARAQGEFLNRGESGVGLEVSGQFSLDPGYYTPDGVLAGALGYSFWGCVDPGVEVQNAVGKYANNQTVFAYGVTVHPLKFVLQLPVQPFASFAHFSSSGVGGTSEGLGVYGRIPAAKNVFIVPRASVAWSDLSNSEAVYAADITSAVRLATRTLLTVGMGYERTDFGDGFISFGIGLVELEPPHKRHR